jgi:hypothetical protein
VSTPEPLPLPDFVTRPIFPFVGDLQVRGIAIVAGELARAVSRPHL